MKRHVLLWSTLISLGMMGPVQAQEPHISPEKGKAIYTAHCAKCHGFQGKGDGPEAAKLIVPPTNFHRPESRAKSEHDLRGTIIWGVIFSPMHGWWGKLNGEDMRSVTAHIRQLAPYQPSTP